MTDTTIATIIGASVGSGVTGIFGFITITLQRRAAERQQIRQLAVQVAMENFKIYKESAEAMGHKSMSPIDSFLIHAAYLVAEMDGTLKTDAQIRDHLRRAFAATDAAEKQIDERNEQLRASKKPAA